MAETTTKWGRGRPKKEVLLRQVSVGIYYQSPNYSLDQEDTFIAIEKLQVFINNYRWIHSKMFQKEKYKIDLVIKKNL